MAGTEIAKLESNPEITGPAKMPGGRDVRPGICPEWSRSASGHSAFALAQPDKLQFREHTDGNRLHHDEGLPEKIG